MGDNVGNFFENLGTKIGDFKTDVSTKFKDLGANLSDDFSTLKDRLSEHFTNNLNGIKNFFSGIPEFFTGFWDNLKNFLIGLFVPEDGYFDKIADNLKTRIINHFPYNVYQTAFENLKEISVADTAGLDVNFSDYKVGDTDLSVSTPKMWIPFNFILKYQNIWFTWVRVFCWIFSLIYTINQIIKLLKGSVASDGSHISQGR